MHLRKNHAHYLPLGRLDDSLMSPCTKIPPIYDHIPHEARLTNVTNAELQIRERNKILHGEYQLVYYNHFQALSVRQREV